MLICLIGCTDDEEQKNYYATFDEAVEDSAIQRGLLPPNIPSSAQEIYERHYIDMSLVWVKFTSNADDFSLLLQDLTQLHLEEIRSFGHEIYAVPEWWPDILTESYFKEAQENFPFVIARYDYIIEYGNERKEAQYGHFFLNFTRGEAYYFGGKTPRPEP